MLLEPTLEVANLEQLCAEDHHGVGLTGCGPDFARLERGSLSCLKIALNTRPARLILQPHVRDVRLRHGGFERSHLCMAGLNL